MRVFDGFNEMGPACPVCETKENKPCILAPIVGTSEDDRTFEAAAIHVDCLDLWYFPDTKQIAQQIAVDNS